MGLEDTLRKGLAAIGLAVSFGTTSPASEPVPVPPEQREQLWRAQQVRNELAKIPRSAAEQAQEDKAITAFRCAEEFRKVSDPVTGKQYAPVEHGYCEVFHPQNAGPKAF